MRRRRFLRHAASASASFGILRFLPACQIAAEPPEAAFTSLRERFFLKAMELNPVTATYLGADGYSPTLASINGRLRDWRPEALAVERDFYGGIARELGHLPPQGFAAANRIDHAVMTAELEYMRHQLVDIRSHERAIDTYVSEPFRGVDWQIQGMTEVGGTAAGRLGDSTAMSDSAGNPRTTADRGTEEEWRLVVERVRAIPAYLDAAQTNLKAGITSGNLPDHRLVQRDGVEGAKDNAQYFRRTLVESAAGYLGSRPFAKAVSGELEAAGQAAADAWERFAAFLLEQYDPKDLTDRFAVGAAEYEWRVHHCLRDPRSAGELYDYGAEQVALYEEKVFAVAEEVARAARLRVSFSSEAERRASVKKVMDWLSRDSPKDDAELFAWYREVAERAVAYGREQGLFDIPADYRLDVVPTPPVLQSTIDAAYYPAPPFKQSGVGRFYLSPTGNDPGALKLNNRASVADTAIHEGFPGHDWHYKYMTAHAADISPIRWFTPGAVEDSSSMWQDSMASEGWALYSEDLMAEPSPGRPHGFYTAAEHLYELQGQLLRAVRVRVDVGIHTGRMSFDEAVDYFTERVGFYPGARDKAATDPVAQATLDQADRAIYRYSKWPTQAITYNLGKNAIVKLREAYLARYGADKLRTFHERFMEMGTIPAGYFGPELLKS